MAKINETLSDEAHQFLKDYQHSNACRNQSDALNEILIGFKGRLEKERVAYWKPISDAKEPSLWAPGTPFEDGDLVNVNGEMVRMRTKERLFGDKK